MPRPKPPMQSTAVSGQMAVPVPAGTKEASAYVTVSMAQPMNGRKRARACGERAKAGPARPKARTQPSGTRPACQAGRPSSCWRWRESR